MIDFRSYRKCQFRQPIGEEEKHADQQTLAHGQTRFGEFTNNLRNKTWKN